MWKLAILILIAGCAARVDERENVSRITRYEVTRTVLTYETAVVEAVSESAAAAMVYDHDQDWEFDGSEILGVKGVTCISR